MVVLEKYLVLFKQNYVLVAFAYLAAYAYCRFTAADGADEDGSESVWTLISASLVAVLVFAIIYIHGLSDGDFEEIIQGDPDF